MTALHRGYHDIRPHELAAHLLRHTGQTGRRSIDTPSLLDYLKLIHARFSFARELPEEVKKGSAGGTPRAMISLSDRLLATDSSLDECATRWGLLHEVAHYVLPDHDHAVYLCDDAGLGAATRLVLEREANEFAAELLFRGDAFTTEANARPVSAATVKDLALKYGSPFPAAARRMVEKGFQPSMLAVFHRQDDVPGTGDSAWRVHHCVASPGFKSRYYARIRGSAPREAVAAVTAPGRDIADSYLAEVRIPHPPDTEAVFRAEYFSSGHNIFCLLMPVGGNTRRRPRLPEVNP